MSPAPLRALAPRVRAARLATIASCLGLILLYGLHSLLFAASAPDLLLWGVLALPLAAFLPGLFKRNPRAYQWLCFLILAYFLNGVLAAFTPGGLLVGALEILLCLVLFASAIVFVHGYRKLPPADMP